MTKKRLHQQQQQSKAMNAMSISSSGAGDPDGIKPAVGNAINSYSRVSTRSNSMEDEEYEIPSLMTIDDFMVTHLTASSSVSHGKPTFCIKLLFFFSISAILFLGSIAYMLSNERTSIYIKMNVKSNPRVKSKKDLVGGLLGAMAMYAALLVSAAYVWYKKAQHRHHVLEKDND